MKQHRHSSGTYISDLCFILCYKGGLIIDLNNIYIYIYIYILLLGVTQFLGAQQSWRTPEEFYLKSQVVYSKQPKLGLTQEFVVDCAHALWVVRSIKRLVSLMLMK